MTRYDSKAAISRLRYIRSISHRLTTSYTL